MTSFEPMTEDKVILLCPFLVVWGLWDVSRCLPREVEKFLSQKWKPHYAAEWKWESLEGSFQIFK